MDSPSNATDDLFESLRKEPEKSAARAKEVEERERAYLLKAQRRLGELIGNNSTLPVTINSIRLIGGANTRRPFLDRLFNPLLSANRDRPYTLAEALKEVDDVTTKLSKFDIYHEPVSAFVGRPDPTNPNSTPTDIDLFFKVREKGRFSAKGGTDLGNVEGSVYTNFTLRNIFGGAESLNLNYAKGTRTKSAFLATFNTPVLSDPDKRLAVDVLASATDKPWSSHQEGLQGAGVKYTFGSGISQHQFGYTGVWRQVTSLAEKASPTVRADAGDSVKSSITHTWISDKRNHPFLPNRGYLLKTVSEIAGWGPLYGDVAFWKSEMETSAAIPIPIPGIKGDSGISLTGGLRAGMLYPLPVGFGSTSQPSRINDRFTLGGPTDVRGFKMAGLGPHDGGDAVGGDIYTAGSLNLLMPMPRVGKDTPLRFQLFANAGRLMALKHNEERGGQGNKAVQKDFYGSIAQLGEGLPSMAAGFGLVYAHPVARFELNFALPLILRRGEEGRKGLQFGVGINFL